MNLEVEKEIVVWHKIVRSGAERDQSPSRVPKESVVHIIYDTCGNFILNPDNDSEVLVEYLYESNLFYCKDAVFRQNLPFPIKESLVKAYYIGKGSGCYGFVKKYMLDRAGTSILYSRGDEIIGYKFEAPYQHLSWCTDYETSMQNSILYYVPNTTNIRVDTAIALTHPVEVTVEIVNVYVGVLKEFEIERLPLFKDLGL